MKIVFSKSTHPLVFQSFVNAIKYIKEKDQTNNRADIINLIEKEFGIKLIQKDRHENQTKWAAHFPNKQEYMLFLLRWSS